jgi:Leucine-rich repeat (LRR) protein
LRYLGLNGNSISELPGRLFALQNITHLNISENDFNEIQNGLANLSSLVHLDISGHHDADIPPEIFDLFESGIAVCDYLDTPEVPIFFLRWALQFREDALSDNDGGNCREIKSLVQGTVDLLRFWAVDLNSSVERWVLNEQEYGLTGPENAGYVLLFAGGTLGQELFDFSGAIDGLGSFPIYDDLESVARILVDNEECIFSQGCDLAQMWMIYHFDDITVTRADGRSLSDQNLKDIELNISEDIYDDFDEEGYELRLEFTPAADKMSLTIDFLRQY